MPAPMPEPAPSPPTTRGEALSVALAALDALAEQGETIEDEWTYVAALAEAGRVRLHAAAGIRAATRATALAEERAGAVAAVAAEAARITDPHRAIDWLSTLPAVVELALGEPSPARAAAG